MVSLSRIVGVDVLGPAPASLLRAARWGTGNLALVPDDPLAQVLAPDYLSGLDTLSMDDLRARKAECQRLETTVSLNRRVVQGRIDIVGAVLESRQGGGEPADVTSLVERLGDILSERTRTPGVGRLSQLLAPSEEDFDTSEVDEVLPAGRLDTLTESSDDELQALLDALVALDHDISARRQELFERIDTLHDELVRRYKTGEATVDSLLS